MTVDGHAPEGHATRTSPNVTADDQPVHNERKSRGASLYPMEVFT